jgi:hypothetical protein
MIIHDSYDSKTDIVHDVRLSGLFVDPQNIDVSIVNSDRICVSWPRRIVGMVAVDVAKISEACLSLQYLWSGILETLAVLVVFSFFIGINVLAALGVIAVSIPWQYYLGLVVPYRKKELSKISTKRV